MYYRHRRSFFMHDSKPALFKKNASVCRVNGATRAQIDALAAEMRTRGCEMLLALKQMPM